MASLNDMKKKNLQNTKEYKNLYEIAITVSEDLASNNLEQVKKIVNKWASLFGKSGTHMDHDDFLSFANMEIWKIALSFDPDKNDNMKEFIKSRLQNKMKQTETMLNREKRTPYLRDENGKIIFDENEKPIKAKLMSFDSEQKDDEKDLKETVSSSYDLENSCFNSLQMTSDINIQNYLSKLGVVEREIAFLISEGYAKDEILAKLGLTEKKYASYLRDMKSYEKKRILIRSKKEKSLICSKKDKEKCDMTSTSEKTKNTSYSVASICKKLKKHRLRDDHVLQRSSGQWNLRIKSELISDLLQGKSLTQIIISEEVKDGVQMLWLIDGKQRCTNIDDYLKDGFAVSNNVTKWNIEYQADKLDENGNVILNADGFPIPEVKHFDIRKKKFSQLPEELQDKLCDYQIPVMLNLNCTKKDIAYDISRFNRCRPMNIAQNGWTGMDEEYAEYIDNILKMDFFKVDSPKSSYTKNNDTSGALRRMIVESLVLTYFKGEVGFKDFRKMCEYISENAAGTIFIEFYDLIEQLVELSNEKTAKLFNIKNSFIWFSLFNKFISYGKYEKIEFKYFMEEFIDSLHSKEINGITYDAIEESSKSTKDAKVINSKLELLESLLNLFLKNDNTDNVKDNDGICKDTEKTSESSNVETILDFVKENINCDTNNDDIAFYNNCVLDSLKYDEDLPIYKQCKKALIAIMAYACQKNKDVEFEKWIKQYKTATDETFSPSQNINYMFLKNDFDNYIQKGITA